MNNYVLIMAGGVGSRFWPKSRTHFPKQFIDVLGLGKSLLQLTYERFLGICPKENIYILGNQQYKGLIQDQIPDLPEEQILLEPSRNNTAPCIAYACYKILKNNSEAIIVVAPSDHIILKEELFLNKINQAIDFAGKQNALITLGIKPTRPDTGYGYINFENTSKDGIHQVLRFMEKPVLEKAIEFVNDGNYLWNAGIFIWSAKSIREAFKRYSPEIHNLFEEGLTVYNTNEEADFIEQNYPKSPNISIDYAILEYADNVYTIPADIGWSDLGTWGSLHVVAEKDESENVVNTNKIKLVDTGHCIIHLPENKVAVIKGLQDYIIVDDNKILLIYPKTDEQEIKEIAKQVVDDFGSEFG